MRSALLGELGDLNEPSGQGLTVDDLVRGGIGQASDLFVAELLFRPGWIDELRNRVVEGGDAHRNLLGNRVMVELLLTPALGARLGLGWRGGVAVLALGVLLMLEHPSLEAFLTLFLSVLGDVEGSARTLAPRHQPITLRWSR